MISDSVLVESKSARDGRLANVSGDRAKEVMAKAKGLIYFQRFGSNELATNEQMADFYEVPEGTIKTAFRDHRDEFLLDGTKSFKGNELRDAKAVIALASQTSQATLWTPRGALRLGMMLRDSEVASAVRTSLLDENESSGQIQPDTLADDPIMAQLQMLMQVRQQQVEQDKKIDAQRQLIEKQNAEISEQRKILNEFQKVRADAHRDLIALPPSTHDIPPESADMKVRRLINNYCAATGVPQSEAFRNLYQQHYYRYRRRVNQLKGESKLQAFVRLGLVDSLYELAVDIFGAQSTQSAVNE